MIQLSIHERNMSLRPCGGLCPHYQCTALLNKLSHPIESCIPFCPRDRTRCCAQRWVGYGYWYKYTLCEIIPKLGFQNTKMNDTTIDTRDHVGSCIPPCPQSKKVVLCSAVMGWRARLLVQIHTVEIIPKTWSHKHL